eukprot:4041830-Karenia_brevis.AAC.1
MDDDGPDIRGLAPIRITIPTDGWDVPTRVDNWHREVTSADTVVTGPAWKGKTLFVKRMLTLTTMALESLINWALFS